MSKETDLDKALDNALTRFFYGKILEALYKAELELASEEQYEAAGKIKDKIEKLEEQFQYKLKK